MAINTDKSKYCKKCMMPVLPKAASDSDVSFLFASMHCLCDAPRVNARSKGDANDFCRKCKKLKPSSASKAGSFTGFLFAATRCRCAQTQVKSVSKQSIKDSLDLSTIIHPTQADRTRRKARTQMVQQNKTQKPGHTQALLANESSRAMISLQPGLEIGGTYQLEQHIGEGGMGSV